MAELCNIEDIMREICSIDEIKNKQFFKDASFRSSIIAVYESKTEEELKSSFDNLVEKILDNTDIRFNYNHPMIWDNWGLDKDKYAGSHGGIGTEYGYGSNNRFERYFKSDLDDLLRRFFWIVYTARENEMYIAEKNGRELKGDTVWAKLIKKDEYKHFNGETLAFAIDFLGKIWLENMKFSDLKNLKIKYKSNLILDSRDDLQKNYIISSTSKTFSLMLYAVELMAKYSLDIQGKDSEFLEELEKDKIYLQDKKNSFLDEEKFSEIDIAVPIKLFTKYNTGSSKNTFIPLNGTIKDLTVAIKDFIKAKKILSDRIKTLEEKQDEQSKQEIDKYKVFLGLSNKEYIERRIAVGGKRILVK